MGHSKHCQHLIRRCFIFSSWLLLLQVSHLPFMLRMVILSTNLEESDSSEASIQSLSTFLGMIQVCYLLRDSSSLQSGVSQESVLAQCGVELSQRRERLMKHT